MIKLIGRNSNYGYYVGLYVCGENGETKRAITTTLNDKGMMIIAEFFDGGLYALVNCLKEQRPFENKYILERSIN